MGFPVPDLSPLTYVVGFAAGGFVGIVISCIIEALGFLVWPALAGWALPIILVMAILGTFLGGKFLK